MFRRSLIIALLALGLAACDDTLEKECAQFADWSNETSARAAKSVPQSEREAAHTNAARAAWLRKLADAYDAESQKPSVFTHPRVQGYETRQKQAYTQFAAALRLTADGWDKGDKAMVEQGQINDTEAGGVVAEIGRDWVMNCRQPE